MAFIAPLALGLGAVGAGVSAVGTIAQGQATANAAHYSAQVAQNNAKIAEQNAEYSTNAGQAHAAASSLKSAATGGRIRATQAASGVDVNTGSAVDVQESQRELGKLDTETVLNNAELQAYGYRTQAANFKSQAELDELKADQAPIGAALGAGGGLLSDASSLGWKWSQIS